MRKFVVADLHGNGEVYDSIMAYLENISLIEDVELYINGDLIDRGLDSFRMFEDIIERINGKGNIKINYIGGNHELSMYQALRERKPGKCINFHSNWVDNGGWVIEGELDLRDDYEEKCEEYKEFLSNLKLCYKLDELINNKEVIIAHAQIPEYLEEACKLKLGDENKSIVDIVWTRPEIRVPVLFGLGDIIGYNRIGKEGYLGIVGHSTVHKYPGFIYDEKENYFNIDGGCSYYALGYLGCDHVPVVEVRDDCLKLLVFNNNNEIIDGYYFNGELIKMNNQDIGKERLFINHSYDNNGLENKKMIKELFNDIKN